MSGTPCPPKRHVPLQLTRDRRTDAAHALQPLEGAEWTVCRSVLDYPTGQRRSNPWQALDFGCRRGFQIDRFAPPVVGAKSAAGRRRAPDAPPFRTPPGARRVAPVTRRHADPPLALHPRPPLRRNGPDRGPLRPDRRTPRLVFSGLPTPRPRHSAASTRAIARCALSGPTASARRLLSSPLPPGPLHLRQLRVERHPPARPVAPRHLIPSQPAPPHAKEDQQREQQRCAIGRGLSHVPRLPAPSAPLRIIRLQIVSKERWVLRKRVAATRRPRGAQRRTPVSRHRCTSAHATSPTIFNDSAEILSIVSSGV